MKKIIKHKYTILLIIMILGIAVIGGIDHKKTASQYESGQVENVN